METPKLENIRFILIEGNPTEKPTVKIIQDIILHTPGLEETDKEVITNLLIQGKLKNETYTVDIRRVKTIKEFCHAIEWLVDAPWYPVANNEIVVVKTPGVKYEIKNGKVFHNGGKSNKP